MEDTRQVDFDTAINELVGRFEDRILFKYVGPTPPYNFIEIVIHFTMSDGR